MNKLMTDQELKDNIHRATTFMRVASGPEYYFWEGYVRGLSQYYNNEERDIDGPESIDEDDDGDFELQGYRLGLAGNSVQIALATGKQGKYLARLNRNYHKNLEDDYLNKIEAFYNGRGKWTLPEGATIRLGERDPGLYLGARDADNWVIKLANGSELVVWSEDIKGIAGPPWDSD